MMYMNGGKSKVDLYFAGSTHKKSNAKLVERNCNRLFSQVINRSEMSKMAELKRSGEYIGKIFMDSGAFTAHRQGIEVDVDDYIDYLNSLHDCLDVMAQVDTIPGQFGKPKTKEQLNEAPKLSWDNYLYMRERVEDVDKLTPIFHQGEDLYWLHNMLEETFNGKHVAYIGISPANDKPQKEKNKFIDMCFRVIAKSSNPDVKTHAYGMTNLKVLERYPFTSADSSSWAMCSVNGSIMSPYGVIPISDRLSVTKSYRVLSDSQKAHIDKIIEDRGYKVEDLRQDYICRQFWNIDYLQDWAESYTYKPVKVSRRSLLY